MTRPNNAPPIWQPEVVDHGMWISHDFPCPVCQELHALGVQSLHDDHKYRFHPCVNCTEKGWELRLKPPKPKKLPGRPWWAFWR